jgi:hypothetical protein
MWTMLTELQRLVHMEERLSDRIDARCGGLEHQVSEGKHKAEECFIALEMSHTELESGRANMVKNFDDLKLEVTRINRFLLVGEHGQCARQAGILSGTK